MKKGIKKLFSALLSVAVITSMSSVAFAQTDTTGTAKEEKSTKIVSSLGMFSPKAGTEEIEINKDTAKITVSFDTTKTRKYTKLALAEQTKKAAELEKAAKNVKVEVKEADGKYVNHVEFTIPASKLGTEIPFTLYQEYKKADGTDDTGWKVWEQGQKYLTVKFTPELVDQLIEAIYDKDYHAGSATLCVAAKKGWDALTDAEKEAVEEGGYFADETGDASLDNPLNQDKIGKTEVLVTSFGTSFNQNRVDTIGAVEKAIAKAFPKYSVRRAFTAQIIINHVFARDGEVIDNIEQGLERAVKNGVKNLVVQPTTLMSGHEYDEVVEAVKKYEKKFDQVVIGKPMCASNNDKEVVLDAVYKSVAEKQGVTVEEAKAGDTAYVLMGHGTSHASQKLYTDLQELASEKGYKNVFVGTVEGEPESTEVNEVIKAVKEAGYKKVILRPIMVVAGDHANNDMAGEEDAESWLNMFKAAGFTVDTQIVGMGQLPEIQKLFAEHAQTAAAKLATPATTAITKTKAGVKKVTVTVKTNKANKGYEVRYSMNKNMKNAKIKTVAGKTVTIKNLKSKKTYYVQARSYAKNAAGKKIYTSWTKAKAVKVK